MPLLVTSVEVGDVSGAHDADILQLVHFAPVTNSGQLSVSWVDGSAGPACANRVIDVMQIDRHGIALSEDVTIGFGLHHQLLTRSNSAVGEEVSGVFGGSTG